VVFLLGMSAGVHRYVAPGCGSLRAARYRLRSALKRFGVATISSTSRSAPGGRSATSTFEPTT